MARHTAALLLAALLASAVAGLPMQQEAGVANAATTAAPDIDIEIANAEYCVSTALAQVTEEITNLLAYAEETLISSVADVEQTLAQGVVQGGKSLTQSVADAEQCLRKPDEAERLYCLVTSFAQAQKELVYKLADTKKQYKSTLVQTRNALATALDKIKHDLNAKLVTGDQCISERMAAVAPYLVENLNEGKADLHQQVSDEIDRLSQSYAESRDTIENSFTESKEQLFRTYAAYKEKYLGKPEATTAGPEGSSTETADPTDPTASTPTPADPDDIAKAEVCVADAVAKASDHLADGLYVAEEQLENNASDAIQALIETTSKAGNGLHSDTVRAEECLKQTPVSAAKACLSKQLACTQRILVQELARAQIDLTLSLLKIGRTAIALNSTGQVLKDDLAVAEQCVSAEVAWSDPSLMDSLAESKKDLSQNFADESARIAASGDDYKASFTASLAKSKKDLNEEFTKNKEYMLKKLAELH